MPPRSRNSAAATATGATGAANVVGFGSLPDALVVKIFGCLKFLERHRHLPLVCTAWSHLVDSPELLRNVNVHIHSRICSAQPAIKLARFVDWLLQRSGSVERLELQHMDSHYNVDHTSELGCLTQECWMEFRDAMSSLGQAPLRELVIRQDVIALELWWEPGPLYHSLRFLEVVLLEQEDYAEAPLMIYTPLQACTGLTDLRLSAWYLKLDGTVAFPPSLTALYLGHHAPSAISPKLDILLKPMRQLRHIGLRGFCLSGVDFGAFGSTLERLSLRDCGVLPSAVSRLTGLRSLAWEHVKDYTGAPKAQLTGAAIDGTLRHLTQLTFLALQPTDPVMTELPRSLTSLRQLHTFCCKTFPPCLPAEGPWLRSLRQLVVPPTVAAASLPALAAATQLESLCLLSVSQAVAMEGLPFLEDPGGPAAYWKAVDEVSEWAANRPHIDFDPSGERLYPAVAQQLMALTAHGKLVKVDDWWSFRGAHV